MDTNPHLIPTPEWRFASKKMPQGWGIYQPHMSNPYPNLGGGICIDRCITSPMVTPAIITQSIAMVKRLCPPSIKRFHHMTMHDTAFSNASYWNAAQSNPLFHSLPSVMKGRKVHFFYLLPTITRLTVSSSSISSSIRFFPET